LSEDIFKIKRELKRKGLRNARVKIPELGNTQKKNIKQAVAMY
jgi:hypothetical protein